jgi:hypothetical protein
MRNILGIAMMLIGRYGGRFWQTLGFWELDARIELKTLLIKA